MRTQLQPIPIVNSEAGKWARRIHSLWFLQFRQGLNDELRRRKLPALSNPARRIER